MSKESRPQALKTSSYGVKTVQPLSPSFDRGLDFVASSLAVLLLVIFSPLWLPIHFIGYVLLQREKGGKK